VTASVDDQPVGEQPADQPGSDLVRARPWAAPGPDVQWWRGHATDAVEALTGVPDRPIAPRRPAPSRRPRAPRPTPRAITAPAITAPAITAPAITAPVAAALVAAAPGPTGPPPIAARPVRELPAAPLRAVRPVRKPQPVRRPRATRHPLLGLAALLLLGLLATFFAWSSAEPLWLSLGHGTPGTATVADCRVRGLPHRCADFAAKDGGFVAEKVTLLGTGPLQPGTTVPARMVSATGTAAYADSPLPRWIPDLLAVLLCGFGIAWLTGAYRLPGTRARVAALVLSLAGPILLTGGLLAATW
jgi:hypothetical protein